VQTGRIAVTRNEGRVGEQGAQVRGRRRLTALRTQRHQVGGEHRIGAELALDRDGGGDVGDGEQIVEVAEGESEHAEHAVGAVDEGETLLLFEHERSDAGGGEGVGCRHERARRSRTSPRRAPPARGAKRGEIARAPERAVLPHDRGDPGVEHRGVGLDDDRADARVSGREGLQAQQVQGAHDLAFHLRTGAGRVGADEARLQLAASLRRDEGRRQRPEAGRDAVVRFGVVGEALDELRAAPIRVQASAAISTACAVAGHGDDLGGCQGARADEDVIGKGRSGDGGHASIPSRLCPRGHTGVAFCVCDPRQRRRCGPSPRCRSAADQTLRILSYLARQRGPVAARTISEGLGIPRSSVYHLLAAMAAHGFVVHLPHDRRWGLGTAAFELAGGYARQQPLAARAVPSSRPVRPRRREHACGGDDRPRRAVHRRGARRGAPRSSRTWACGCRLTSRRRDERCSPPCRASRCARSIRMPRPSPTARAADRGARPSCASCCAATRAAGFASEDGEVTLGFRSVAVAVRDHAGWPVAAIAVTWPAEAGHTAEALAPAVTSAADELQRRLYG
jgi:DNA-binding IclR family transcriptional regulator